MAQNDVISAQNDVISALSIANQEQNNIISELQTSLANVNTEASNTYATKSDVYTKTEANSTFAAKGDVYTKTEANNAYAAKGDVYTKTESNNAYAAKNDVYTKTQADTAFATKSEASVTTTTLLASTTGTTAKSFNSTGYKMLLITIEENDVLYTAEVMVSDLSSSTFKWMACGSKDTSSGKSSDRSYALFKIYSNKIELYTVYRDGTSYASSATVKVYGIK